MKRFLLILAVALTSIAAVAKVDIDLSSKFEEGTKTIVATKSWGWYAAYTSSLDVSQYEYLHIKYEATCKFNLILQDPSWHTAYSVTCDANATEGYIKLVPGAYDSYSCVVIQNHTEGEITIKQFCFCTEDEFYNPAPDDLEEARDNLVEIFLRYQAMLDDFPVGTAFGTYPEDLYQALTKALDAVGKLNNAELNALTVDELNTMAQNIVDAYRALVAGQNRYLPADGYYRFVCARQFYSTDEESGETSYLTKAMYSTNTGENKWKTIDLTDPTFLWTLQRQDDNTYLLRNASNQLIFSEAEKCTETEKYIAIDPIVKGEDGYDFSWTPSTEEDVVVFNFRMSTEPAGGYKYIHCNWHDGGKGWGGPMTLWCNTTDESGASEWYIESVPEDEALALLNENAYGREFILMLQDAKEKVAIANDMIRTQLITEAGQFSSPYSQNDLGSRDGGDLSAGVLLDGDNSTFWHSYWSGGSLEAGIHYLQVELAEPITGDIELNFARRKNTDSDHVTQWGIYGSDQPDGEKYDFEWIADLDTPYGESGERIAATFGIDADKEYKYLRFYAEQTKSSRGYFHISEFQLYHVEENPTNQAAALGDLYTQLVAAIATAEEVDQNAVSRADYEALKAAYDSFMERFVDPTPLREALYAAESLLKRCEVGNNPGQWSQESMSRLEQNLADAWAYDRAGHYTQEKSAAYAASVSAQAIVAAANRVSPNKYYAFRFASAEKYEEQGWSTSNVEDSQLGMLYDTYVRPAEAQTLENLGPEAVRQGTNMFFADGKEGDIAFRFIPAGDDDNTFIIQHKASGLFVHAYNYDSWTGLTLTPTLFTIEPAGYGECLIHGTDYEGTDMAYLHAQLSDHRLVTWHSNTAGTNSGLLIEEVGDVTSDDQPGTPLADYRKGEVTTMCYPVAVAPSAGLTYTVVGTYEADAKVYVALNRVERAGAGQPVVYISEGAYNAEAEEDVNVVALTVGTTIAAQPMNEGALKGVYKGIDLEAEAIIFRGGTCEISTEETAHISDNRAYVELGATEADPAAEYSLVLEVGGDLTGIHDALTAISQRANVYNTAGQLVRAGASLREVQMLPMGLYIFNGKKLLVK